MRVGDLNHARRVALQHVAFGRSMLYDPTGLLTAEKHTQMSLQALLHAPAWTHTTGVQQLAARDGQAVAHSAAAA